MTVFLTVFSGVLVFILGQVLLKLFLEPIHELKKVISRISFDLIKSANIFSNPDEGKDDAFTEASKIMREHASSLHAYFYLVPLYRFTSRLFGMPSEEDILKATKQLIRLSNGKAGPIKNQGILNAYAMQNIKLALGIAIPKSEWLDPEKERDFIKAS